MIYEGFGTFSGMDMISSRLVRDWRSAYRGLKEALTNFRNLLLRQVEGAEE